MNMNYDQAFYNRIDSYFKEGAKINPSSVGSIPLIQFTKNTDLYFTFLGESSSFKKTLGYYIYDPLTKKIVVQNVFKNASGRSGGVYGGGLLNRRDTVNLSILTVSVY